MTEDQLNYMRAFIPADKRVESRLLSDPFDSLVRRVSTGGIFSDGELIYNDDYPPSFAAKIANSQGVPLLETPREISWRPVSAEVSRAFSGNISQLHHLLARRTIRRENSSHRGHSIHHRPSFNATLDYRRWRSRVYARCTYTSPCY